MKTRNDIFEYCQAQLKELYPAGIPQEMTDRLNEEMEQHLSLCSDEAADQLILYHELSQAAHRTHSILELDGTANSSVFVYLLDAGHELNPLPAHYYCEHCGHYESGFKEHCGIDLKEKCCPECGSPMRRDGYTLYHLLAWRDGNALDFDYRISENFHHTAADEIRRHYEGRYNVVPTGAELYWRHADSDRETHSLKETGVAILPLNENNQIPEKFSSFTGYLPDGRMCIKANDLTALEKRGIRLMLLFTGNVLDILQKLQEETGVLPEDIGEYCHYSAEDLNSTGFLWEDAQAVLSTRGPGSFSDMASSIVSTQNVISSSKSSKMPSGQEAADAIFSSDYPVCTREDAYEYLRTWLSSDEEALNAADMLFMGKITKHNAGTLLHGCPESFVSQAVRTRYLFPRSHAASFLKKLMLLAWYLKNYPQQYARVVRREN